jgi:hypothetical protein
VNKVQNYIWQALLLKDNKVLILLFSNQFEENGIENVVHGWQCKKHATQLTTVELFWDNGLNTFFNWSKLWEPFRQHWEIVENNGPSDDRWKVDLVNDESKGNRSRYHCWKHVRSTQKLNSHGSQ